MLFHQATCFDFLSSFDYSSFQVIGSSPAIAIDPDQPGHRRNSTYRIQSQTLCPVNCIFNWSLHEWQHYSAVQPLDRVLRNVIMCLNHSEARTILLSLLV